ncbi:MAG: L,D-transpeptidase [Gaiellaceae bacterium]
MTGGAVSRRLLVLVVVAGGLLAAGCGGATRPTLETGSTVSLQPHTEAAVRHVRQHPGESIVATAVTRSVPVYRSPSAAHPFARLSNPTAVGAPLVFLVQSRSQGWEHVLLPIRPDGATGWVKDRNVSLAWNPYSLEASLKAHRLVLKKDGRVAASFPAAVGRSVLPTPTGRYYIVELLKQPNPNGAYGPYAFGTSAFSKVLYHFGGGPGQIGIHGTDEHGSIGHSVSHGCIRLRNRDIVRLAHLLPLGTPVTILQ